MNDYNPYLPPQSDVTPPILPDDDDGSGELLPVPRSLSAGAGMSWLSEGWSLVKGNLGIWLLILITLGAIGMALGFVPVARDVVFTLIGPVLRGGILMGLRAADQGYELRFGHLFDGFRYKFVPLLGLGALTLGVSVLAGAMGAGAFDPESLLNGLNVVFIAVGVVLFLVYFMLVCFAEPLIALSDVPVFAALSLSMKGCLRNPLAILVYMLLVSLLVALVVASLFALYWLMAVAVAVVAGFVLLLAFLFMIAWLAGSNYVAYKQIFLK
jgi:hypothetical protein